MVGRESLEYLIQSTPTQEDLRVLSEQGWELLGVDGGQFYFKRPPLDFRERVTLEQKARYYSGRPQQEPVER